MVAHEMAHRVLEHIRKGNVNCDAERQSNALIKKWGFKKEFKEASGLFGQKKGDPAACQEVRIRAMIIPRIQAFQKDINNVLVKMVLHRTQNG